MLLLVLLKLMLLLLLQMHWVLLVQGRSARGLRGTGTGSGQAGEHVFTRGIPIGGGQRTRTVEVRVTGTHRGRTIVVELVGAVTHIVEVGSGVLVTGIVVPPTTRLQIGMGWKWWRRWQVGRALLFEHYALTVGVVVDGIQRNVFAVAVVQVPIALAQTSQLAATGNQVGVIHDVVVQSLQIGGGQ